MNKKLSSIVTSTIMAISMGGYVQANEPNIPFDQLIPQAPNYNNEFDRNRANLDRALEQQRAAAEREAMRDKSHDFPRQKIGNDTSIGARLNDGVPEVNIRHTQ
ncbi:MAG: hypothetical protein ACRBBN_12490 [Methyloligellaceae bacterium]